MSTEIVPITGQVVVASNGVNGLPQLVEQGAMPLASRGMNSWLMIPDRWDLDDDLLG